MAHDPGGAAPQAVPRDEVTKMLQTPFDSVFRLSPDGAQFMAPSSVRGLVVKKLTEEPTEWKSPWLSLDAYLAKEPEEERLKLESKLLKDNNPHSEKHDKQHKNHVDNISKHRKIRQWFGPDKSHHPNQVVAPEHLPYAGLCEQDTMYHMGCKLSDLQELHDQGELAMDPFDFLRWRISLGIQEKLVNGMGRGDEVVKSVVNNLGCLNSSDKLFREAVLRSAQYQRRSKQFGSKKKTASGNDAQAGD